MLFVITRKASLQTNSLSQDALVQASANLLNTLSQALGLSEWRITLVSLSADSATGVKYWRVQFLVLVDSSSEDPEAADVGRDPQRWLDVLAGKLRDSADPTHAILDEILPGLDAKTPFLLQAYKATPDTLTKPVDMCVLLGPDAPKTCDCKVSEWTEWTVCDSSCTSLKSKRTRTILNTDGVARPSACPPLEEERNCTGQSKIYSFSLPDGVNLGSQSEMDSRLQICSAEVLSSMQAELQVAAPEHLAFEGNTLGLWKFSALLSPKFAADQAASALDSAMANSQSKLFEAIMKCMLPSGSSVSVPLPTIVQSPNDELLCS